MKLIDRYVFAVIGHLPEDIREDVGKELRTNIEDMLPENPTEGDIYKTLEKLGNPWKLAAEYKPEKRYLIGPILYDKYFSVLKMVLGIVISVLVSITLFFWIFKPSVEVYLFENIVKLFVELILAVIQAVIQGTLWVTIIFAVIERTGAGGGEIPFLKKKWSPSDLPDLPVSNKGDISRGETVFSMFFSILFISVLFFKPQLIALYIKDSYGIISAIPLFEIERLHSYFLIVLLFTLVQLGINIWKYILRRWNISLAVVNLMYNIAFCILIIIMINDSSLINNQFIIKIAELISSPLSQIIFFWDRSIMVFAVMFCVISIWDSISKFLNCRD